MKRLLAISLITILLLNTMGYYAVFLGIQYTHNEAFLKVLDAGTYDVSHTVTLKIPISIPYMPDNVDFERVDGLFEYQGRHYRLVKQKYATDTLTVVCIVDHEKKELDQQLSNYLETFSDKATDHPAHTKHTLNFIKDYLPQYTTMTSIAFGWENNILYREFSCNLIPFFECSIIHPPERRA